LTEVAGKVVAPDVIEAARGLSLGDPSIIVLASPHGRATGVYASPAGDLGPFGRSDVAASAPTDRGVVAELARAWGRPVLDAPADHGIVVPLRLLGPRDVPVIALTFEEGREAAATTGEAETLAGALGEVAGTVAFVASANTSAGLTERAPLPSLPGAEAAEHALLDALESDPRRVPSCLPALTEAGSCAAGPLAALSFLLGDRRCKVLAYGHPVGVGYAVASSS
jgi:aromatic ring-opening dioxygenase LigB subunit